MTLSQGDHLGRYEILGPIGAGGMGEVWRARDSELDRDVAIKVLPESFADDSVRLERFQREAKALAALSHPNLLDIYDVGSANGLHYAVTELLEGDTLRERITPTGLPWQKVTEIGGAVADGLAAAHGRGIVHRDLKPENLFLTADGRVKILDFGLAAVHEEASADAKTATITEAGTVMGTPGYMSPEQVKGQQADARSDIFALGCVLYEMVSGHRAFGGDTGAEVIASILKEEPPQLSSSGAAVPVDLERAVHRCLEKRPEARFQSAADLAYSLKGVGHSGTSPLMATPAPSAATPTGASARRWWPVAAAVAVIVAAVFGWQALPERTAEAPAIEVEPGRVATVPFLNQTGDPGLESLGRRAAERIMAELAKVEELQTAPVDLTGLPASAPADVPTLVREVAAATSAGLVVTGVIVGSRDELEVRAAMWRAPSGEVVRDFDTLLTSAEGAEAAFDTLGGWVFVTALETLHPSLRWGAGARIPDPAAFREFLTGLRGMGSGGREHLERAIAIDPLFDRVPFLLATGAIVGGGSGKHYFFLADEVLQPLADRRGSLTSSQQRLLLALERAVAGDWARAVLDTQELVAERPEERGQLLLCGIAMLGNQPQLAIDTFDGYTWDPIRPAGEVFMMFDMAVHAHHLLGQHDQELLLLDRLREEAPEGYATIWYREMRAMALAALGRTDECARVVEDGLLEAGGSLNFSGEMILRAAEELLAHGSEFEGLAMAQRALDWFTGMDFSERALPWAQRNSAVALSLLGQHEAALRTLSALAADQPESWSLLGEVGIEAAWLGDRETATEISQRLLTVDEPFTLGGPSYVRAAIATRLGDDAEGIRLLRQAAAEGFWDWERLHRDMDFEPLRDDPEFQEIVRPKG